MKIMFSTNANKGEKIPATSTRCFDILSTLSFVPRVPSRSVRFLIASRTKRFIPLSVSFWTDWPNAISRSRNLSRQADCRHPYLGIASHLPVLSSQPLTSAIPYPPARDLQGRGNRYSRVRTLRRKWRDRIGSGVRPSLGATVDQDWR